MAYIVLKIGYGQCLANFRLCGHEVRTFSSQNFEDPSTPTLAPELFIFVMQFITQYLSLICNMTSWPRQLELQTVQNLSFCRFVGSNPGRGQKNESNFFLYRLFHIFSSQKYKRDIYKLCRPFSGAFPLPQPLLQNCLLALGISQLTV